MPRLVTSVACWAASSICSLVGQSASYTYFGAPGTVGCGPFGAQVIHTAVNLPKLGSTFQVDVPASSGMCPYLCNMRFFMTGLSNTSFQGVPLPYFSFGACGMLRVSMDVIEVMPMGSSTGATFASTFVIPNAPNLAGLSFYQQSVSLTYILGGLNATAWGRAGHGVIGS